MSPWISMDITKVTWIHGYGYGWIWIQGSWIWIGYGYRKMYPLRPLVCLHVPIYVYETTCVCIDHMCMHRPHVYA